MTTGKEGGFQNTQLKNCAFWENKGIETNTTLIAVSIDDQLQRIMATVPHK